MDMKRLLRKGSASAALLAVAVVGLAWVAGAAASTSTDIVYQANPPHTFVTSSAKPGAFTNPFCHFVNGVPQLVCYSPSDIRTAYGYPSSLDGADQTIVIVDAYGSPTIQSDLATFDAQYGLPVANLTVECPQGCPSFSPNANHGNEVGWAEETSLDVEWSHAMAPGAKIVLVVAATNYGNAINAAESVAFQEYPGAVFSQSFGSFESSISGGGNNIQLQQAHQNYEAAAAAGDTVLASAGDWGATNLGTTENAVYPASDPLVTGIGGTEGNPYYNGLAGQPLPTCKPGKSCTLGLAKVTCQTSGACTTTGYGGEQVWNEPFFGAATGGAESLIFGVPSFQAGVNGSSQRTTPDVSYNATISGGVLTYLGFLGSSSGWYIFGGTSAGSPQWASIVALANEARGLKGESSLGYLNDRLYPLAESGAYGSDFHDITVGNNQLTGMPFGYSAGPGYDIASGWGTPQVGSLVAALASG
jgi:subtilase family serine protease